MLLLPAPAQRSHAEKDALIAALTARLALADERMAAQTEFNQQVANGLYPICIRGGGSTNAPVHAAIFAKQDIPSARQWFATGAAVASLAGFDKSMETFMRANGVRAAQLAIAKNGVMKFSRASPGPKRVAG